jgi:TonB family protein
MTGPSSLTFLAAPLVLVLGSAFAATAAGQSPAPATVIRPPLLPGCALPSPKLIAAAAPLNIELTIAVTPSGSVASVEARSNSANPELEAAFAGAARACRFEATPAARAEGRRLEHRLTYRYASGLPLLGVHGCFAAEYPSLARRTEEEGTTTVRFLVPTGDAAADVRLVRSSDSKSLDAQTLRVANSCLANPGVRAELTPDQWYEQSMIWMVK